MIDKITQKQISVLLLLAKKANPNINLGAWAKWIDYSTFYCCICNNYIKNTNGNAANLWR